MPITNFQPWRLENPILNYAWGSRRAIAELLGNPTPAPQPEAEMWMGAHPKAPSVVLVGAERVALDTLVKWHPEAILGKAAARRFENRMPFLFKVLAAAAPLSIQAHPNKRQALEGFARENDLGLALDAPQRNYRDANHKPEIICALSTFWALSGFRAADAINRLLRRYCPHSFAQIAGGMATAGDADRLQNFLQTMLALPLAQRRHLLDEACQHAAGQPASDASAAWILRLSQDYPEDIGALAPLWLNLLKLDPGEAVFLPAGQLHAYLEGVGIELMANSDNVLRGGLTPKHIDIAELMQVLSYAPTEPQARVPITPSVTETIYATPAEEFRLAVLTPTESQPYQGSDRRNVEILLMTEGAADISNADGGPSLRLQKGDSVLIPAAAPAYRLYGRARIFKAAVPQS
jgi:mannose-6-phosphate isomerase